ncbi:MAG: LytTR family DNA-binding domain-containing protein [Acidobacteriota bacterium]
MRVLIADDEPVARQVLRELLEEMPGMEICGEAATGAEALVRANDLRPDVVLLDLQMPLLDGFHVAQQLRGGMPLVIFVTASGERALDAFELGVADYLVKPVRRERLEAALQKAKARMQPAAESKAAAAAWKEPVRRIAGRLKDEFHMLDVADVIAFKAEGELVYILASKGRFLADLTLKALEERLPAPTFRRIHRSTIINTDHIQRISPLSSKRWLLKMTNGLEAIVSKRMASVIRDQTRW